MSFPHLNYCTVHETRLIALKILTSHVIIIICRFSSATLMSLDNPELLQHTSVGTLKETYFAFSVSLLYTVGSCAKKILSVVRL